MLIVKERQPRCAIFVGKNATWIERHAAEELRGYLRRLSGANVPVADLAPAAGDVIAVGRVETNPVVANAVRRELVKLSYDYPGLDGFIVETAKLDGREVLLLGGSQDRGTLYAVYWFLEEVLGVGFFRDGERIPDMPTIEIGDLRIAERPYFREREDGLIAYSALFWGWEEWKRELDWKARRRANMTWPFHVGGDIVDTILAEWGVLPNPPPRQAEPTLHERLLDYARKLGMRVPCNLPSGALPAAFFEAFPDCRSLLLQWSEYAPYRQLHPADPLFRRLIVEYIRHYRERYGTDHLYIAEFTSESRILEGADNVQQARIDFARAMSEALREADPEGAWIASSWSFDLSADDPGNPWQANWALQDVREYLDAITYPLVVWDTWAEEAAKYLLTDYFYGRRWGFGVLHCFGGETYLHGDIPGLVRRVRALVRDQRARKCDLFLALPENVDYNSIYFELCARLAWNPAAVDVDGFLLQYCRKRYGPSEGELLEPAWRLLLETVYGPESGTVKLIMDPLYWFRPDLKLLHGWPEDDERAKSLWEARKSWPPKLQRAAEVFLSRAGMLAPNDMAVRDLLDIVRQWIAERFNAALIAARDAFLRGDCSALDGAAARALSLLDDQARLLASWPPYRLDRQIEQARAQYGNDAARAVTRLHVWCNPTEGQDSVPLRDYYRMDLDGLVADYYKPRVAAYLDLLQRKLAAGEKAVSEAELDAIYTPIEKAFIAGPPRPLPQGEDPVAIVRELLSLEQS